MLFYVETTMKFYNFNTKLFQNGVSRFLSTYSVYFSNDGWRI